MIISNYPGCLCPNCEEDYLYDDGEYVTCPNCEYTEKKGQ